MKKSRFTDEQIIGFLNVNADLNLTHLSVRSPE
jgi:hypothetical protein